MAEPDTCLEHCLDSNNTYTNYSSGHPIYVDLRLVLFFQLVVICNFFLLVWVCSSMSNQIVVSPLR